MDNETKEILQQILLELQSLKAGQAKLESGQEELRQGVHTTNLKLENIIEPKIQLIYENQVTIIDHDKKLASYDTKIEALETDVFALKYAFKAMKQG